LLKFVVDWLVAGWLMWLGGWLVRWLNSAERKCKRWMRDRRVMIGGRMEEEEG
jgi:hypothetical protein